MITIQGYQLYEKMHQGALSILYRGEREQDKAPVIIETPSSEYPSIRELAKISHEYEITKNLRPQGILRPYSLEKSENSLAIIFEDIGGQTLKMLLTLEKVSLKGFLKIAISLAETLEGLHRENIIHKDINPDHIIVNMQREEVKLWGFGNATSLPREEQGNLNPSVIEGSLAYISPEQSGRMNRILDYRTDFYSLGVTLYEILTGILPFQTTDALELVHCHLAKKPTPPHEVTRGIPKVLSHIVMKLMAKTAEERYQSAKGLKADLERCHHGLDETGMIEEFKIGRQDVSEKFQIAQGLYGREEEIGVLMGLFNEASQGKTILALVSGYAGIGKTSLVKEIDKSITGKNGYFASGKYDQFQRNIPYVGLIHAFQDLVRRILTENRDKIEIWKERLLESLGPNGRIIIEVIPDVEMVIGPQPPVVELGPVEAQNRFSLVFRNFIRVFCQEDHPLVIFLDDLQWVDMASLKLIDLMVADEDTKFLLLICAYRDNEVDPFHPLMIAIEDLRRKGAPLHQVGIGPLSSENVAQLIADTIHSDPQSVLALANLLVEKTDGNPFFVNQLLTTLYEEGLLALNPVEKRWRWDIQKIRSLDITDNVVELLIARLQRLSSETQQVLQLAACIGNRFELKTLGLIVGEKTAEVYKKLLPALQDGLVIWIATSPVKDSLEEPGGEGPEWFKFLHDRVQQAAYSMIDEKNKKPVHLQIGRMLLENTPQEAREERSFDILNHLSAAYELITNPSERDILAEWNLLAAKKAKASAAYEMAFKYLKDALGLTGSGCWERNYALALELHHEAAEAAYLSGYFEQMEELVEAVTQNANSVLDKVRGYQCRILGHMTQNQLSEALAAAFEILGLLGLKFEKALTPGDIRRSIKSTLSLINRKGIEDLINLPQMSDPVDLAILRILNDAALCAYVTHFELFVQLLLSGIHLILRNGNTSLSPFFYSFYGAVLCGTTEDIESGFRMGQLSLGLLEKSEAREIHCKTLMVFNVYIRHFKEHIRETITPLFEAYQAGLETGDLIYAAGSANAYCVREYMMGMNLGKLKKDFENFDNRIRKTNHQATLDVHRIYHQAVSNLIDGSDKPWMLLGSIYNEEAQLPTHQRADNRNALHYFYFNKLILSCLFGQYNQAVQCAQQAENYLDEVTGGLAVPIFHFYDSLAHLGVYGTASKPERVRIIKKVTENQRRMKKWADHAPMNHLHKYHLVEAESCRITGRDPEAGSHYDLAISLAKENKYIHEEAQACELAGRFWLEKGKKEAAGLYLKRAKSCYDFWGARSKTRHLLQEYPELLSERYPEHLGLAGDTLDLDISTMMKASQAISSEIVLDRLLTTFMKIVIENVGAEKGFLLLQSQGRLLVEAMGALDQDEVLLEMSQPMERAEYIASEIVAYVARTQKDIVLSDAVDEGMFVDDPHIIAHRPKSILCSPILYKNELVGVLYLENNLISGAFTAKRLEVVRILASQIAISIENARLYGDLKKAEEKYRAIFENAVEGIFQTTPEGRFISVNPAMARLFGYESAPDLLKYTTDIAHQLYVSPERRSEFVAIMQEGQTVTGFEAEFYRKDVSTFWASLHARPVFDESGRLLYQEGILTDISEQKKAMEALQEREEYLRKENIRLRSNIEDRYKFGNIVGKSSAMQEIYELILRAAATNVNVIIYGESGTGKELVARAIHDMSDRKNRPFVPVNSGAIPASLLESEFFGYKKGAFTGAVADKHGYLDLADGGTLFLDELGEIDLSMQAKLLRAIEGGGFIPVGSTELKKADFRIISATSRDLKEYVRKGLMREDFYYRVHIIPIYLPPLRERKGDIPLLIDHFLKTYDYEGKVPPITGKVLWALLSYEWPGNIRELQNTLHRYFTLKKLDFLGASSSVSGGREDTFPEVLPGEELKLQEAVENFEKNYIRKRLEENQWHRTRVASILGIGRKTLFRKIEDYGLKMTQSGFSTTHDD
jgi:PAS domain S-box-containing protein